MRDTPKTPITAADRLNARVLPYFEQHEYPVLRIPTDTGTEYCDRDDQHDDQLDSALKDIEHTKTVDQVNCSSTQNIQQS